ncbi:MAG TPA: glycosyltransferase family 39 protein, partial [Pirellulales bacterium]
MQRFSSALGVRSACTRYAGLLAALALAAALEAAIIARSPIIAKDGIGFIRIAHELADNPVATLRLEDQHPGYPAMVLAASRLVQRVTGKSDFDAAILGAHLAAALCGVMSVLLLWLFVRRLYEARVANVTGLLAAAWPLLRRNAADGLSDTPHLMFYLAAAWLAAEGIARRRVALLAAAGLASGLAYWVRPEGLVPGTAAGVVLIANLVGRLGWRSSLCRERPLWRSANFELTSHRPPRNATEGVPYREWRDSSPPFISALNAPSERRLWSLAGLGALAGAMLLVASPYVLLAGKVTSKKMPFRAAPSAHAVAIASVEPTAGVLGEPRPGGTLPDEFA